jgi:Dolichyl-phosphate-mannose-protein mannosyltransferase
VLGRPPRGTGGSLTSLEPPPASPAKVLRILLLVGAAWYPLLYLCLACQRLRYPFELEWMEGGGLAQVKRILGGEEMYVRPSLAYVPLIYPPLYYDTAAAFARITGEAGFLSLRLVSFLSSLASFFLIFRMVLRQTGNRTAAFLSSALFAATFKAGGAWLDVARVDSMFLALFLAAVSVLAPGRSYRRCLAAGVLFSLSALTKQTALVMCAPLILCLLWKSWPRAVALAAPMALILGGATVLQDRASGGWFSYYVWLLPRQHAWTPDVLLSFWFRDLLSTLPIVLLMAIFVFLPPLDAHRRFESLFWLAVTAGMFLGSYLMRIFEGGYENVLLPALAILSVLFGLAYSTLGEWLAGLRPAWRRSGEAFVSMTCLVQLAFPGLLYLPGPQLPTEADLLAGRRLVQTIRDAPGEVLVPSHPYLVALAGKEPSAAEIALREVLRSHTPEKEAVEREIAEALSSRRYAMVLLDGAPDFLPDFDRYYLEKARVLQGKEFYPVTGAKRRPEILFAPRSLSGPIPGQAPRRGGG